jgi:hypothetical protein
MAEANASGDTSWSRTGFSNAFKRKGRRNVGSDTTSVASNGTPERRMSTDRPIERVTSTTDPGRRSSTDSSTRTSKLSKILSGKSRKNNRGAGSDLGDAGDAPTSLYSSTAPSDEGPLATEDSGNFTEDSDSEA